MIDAPDAGRIAKSTPGRAYVRLGHASLVPFQAGRVGGRHPGTATAGPPRPPWSAPVDWQGLGRPQARRPANAQASQGDDEITDLMVLVEAVRAANDRLAVPAQHSPWLPPLPETLVLDELEELEELEQPAEPGGMPVAPYGVEDLPAQQARRTAAIDFAAFGHLLAAGAPRSGRSQLLRTIAGSLALTHSTADVHLYGIDCGNGALAALTRLPHCGAVVSRAQTERAVRLIARLTQEMTRRHELLAADGCADIGEQRASAAPGDRLPHIVVVLDRWESWLAGLGEVDGGQLTDNLFAMVREGASVGVHLVITGDRTLLTGRISALTEDKIAFRLADRSDASMIGINPRKLPDEIPAGRAYRNETGIEVQIALLDTDPGGQAQAAALTSIGERARERDASLSREQRPFRVDVLPSRLSFEDAWRMRDPQGPAGASRLWGLAGVGGDELTAYGPDLADGLPAFVIGGPSKSGRSTALLTLARSLFAQGTRLVVAAPRPSPLRRLAEHHDVLRLFTGEDIPADGLTEALERAGGEPVAVIVDDAELLRDCDASPVLREIIARGSESAHALVFAGDEEDICSGFAGWQVDAKRARRGMVLSPQSTMSGDLIGVRLPRSAVGSGPTPGRALLHLGDGELLTVTVPMA